MFKTTYLAAVSLGLSLLAASCSTTSSSVGATEPVSAYEMAVSSGNAYTLTVLRAGNAASVPQGKELRELTHSHEDFLKAMFDESFLLTSGPFVAPRSDTSLRGLFFMDAADPKVAQARTCEDPATKSGVFSMESMSFITDFDLRALPPIERGFRIQRGHDDVVARPFVVVTIPTSTAATSVISQLGETCILHGDVISGSFKDQTLCVLDCTTIGDAKAALARVTSMVDEFTYHPWISSTSVAELN
jgi:uncharacterized protein YciI